MTSSFFRFFNNDSQRAKNVLLSQKKARVRRSGSPLKPRRLATEALEERQLLAASAEMFAALNEYTAFGGGYTSENVNAIEIEAANLSVENLKAAIATAASTEKDDVIFVVGGGQLTFDSADDAFLINLNDETQGSLTIIGYNGTLSINAANYSRIFQIDAGSVYLGSATLSGGSANYGGAIANAGALVLQDVDLTLNVASEAGGAIANKGELFVQECKMVGNSSASDGAAVYNGDFSLVEEANAPVFEGTIADVSAANGATVEIELADYFNDGAWTYTFEISNADAAIFADAPTLANGKLTLNFIGNDKYAENLDLSKVQIVVKATSPADATLVAESNSFNVGLVNQSTVEVRPIFSLLWPEDAEKEYAFREGKKTVGYGAADFPESEIVDFSEDAYLQIWAKDVSSAWNVEALGIQSSMICVRVENGEIIDLEDAFFGATTIISELDSSSELESSSDGYKDYKISVMYPTKLSYFGVDSALLMASVQVTRVDASKPVVVTLLPSADDRDKPVSRLVDGDVQASDVDKSQVAFGSATSDGSTVSSALLADVGTDSLTATPYVDIVNSLIANNTTSGKGAIYVASGASATVGNSTVVKNVGGEAAIYGVDENSVYVGNSIVVDNFKTSVSTEALAPVSVGVLGLNNLTNANWTDSFLYDAAKPLFTGADSGDFSLAKNSQAIDLGDSTLAVDSFDTPLIYDLAGDVRISGASVDVGAYEYQGVAPVAPSGVAFGAYDAATKKATLSWTDVADETGYKVEKFDGSAWAVVETLLADATSFVAESLTDDATYQYRVFAFNNFGASNAVEATLTTTTLPLAPTGFALSQFDATAHTLVATWNDVATNETKYVFEAALAGTENWTKIDLAANSKGAKLTNLSETASYVYRVYAENAAGKSEYAQVSFNASKDVLTAPTFSTAAPKVGETITVSVGTGVATFAWFRVDVDGEIAIEGATGATYSPNAADVGYRLKVVATGANSAYVSVVNATIAAAVVQSVVDAAPAAPTNLVFGQYDAAKMTLPLSWTDNSDNEASFLVQYSTDGGKTWRLAEKLVANKTSRLALTVRPTYEYQFRVCAQNASGDSDWAVASFAASKDVLEIVGFSSDCPAVGEPIFALFASATADATFQWSRISANGTEMKIADATDAVYTPTTDDLNFRLKVVAKNANSAYSFSTVEATTENVVLATSRFTPAAPTNVKFSGYDAKTLQMTMSWDDNSINETGFEVEYMKDGGVSAGEWLAGASLDANVESRICTFVRNYGYEFRIRAVCSFKNDQGETETLASAWTSATFNAARDVVADLALSTDQPQVGVEIVASVAPTNEVVYQWYRVAVGVATAIEGANAAAYAPTDSDVGYSLRVVASSANVAYLGSATAETSGVVGETETSRPIAPSDIVFSEYDPATKTLNMSWTNGSATATQIVVEYKLGSYPWKIAQKLDAGTTSRVATAVAPGAEYLFRLKAVNANGESVYVIASFKATRDVLDSVEFDSAPAVGEPIVAKLGAAGEANFQWYRVVNGGAETAIEGATAATYVPTSEDLGATLKVVATGANVAYFSQVSGVTSPVAVLEVPNAPTNLAFDNYNPDKRTVEMSWNDASDYENGFYVEYSVDGGETWRASATLAANATGRTCWGLKDGVTYQFRVAAFNKLGVSDWATEFFAPTSSLYAVFESNADDFFEAPDDATLAIVAAETTKSDAKADDDEDSLNDFFETFF